MEAIVCTKYGSPDVLQLKEVEKPIPKDDEIQIKVYATDLAPQSCTNVAIKSQKRVSKLGANLSVSKT